MIGLKASLCEVGRQKGMKSNPQAGTIQAVFLKGRNRTHRNEVGEVFHEFLKLNKKAAITSFHT